MNKALVLRIISLLFILLSGTVYIADNKPDGAYLALVALFFLACAIAAGEKS